MTISSPYRTSGKILIVDDQAIEVQLCTITFRNISPDLELQSFRSGEEILDYLRTRGQKEPISMMLLDLKMPRVDGLDVLEAIQAEQLKTCPIVVFTTSRLQQDREKALQLGADEFLEKPVDLTENTILFERLLASYGGATPQKAIA